MKIAFEVEYNGQVVFTESLSQRLIVESFAFYPDFKDQINEKNLSKEIFFCYDEEIFDRLRCCIASVISCENGLITLVVNDNKKIQKVGLRVGPR